MPEQAPRLHTTEFIFPTGDEAARMAGDEVLGLKQRLTDAAPPTPPRFHSGPGWGEPEGDLPVFREPRTPGDSIETFHSPSWPKESVENELDEGTPPDIPDPGFGALGN